MALATCVCPTQAALGIQYATSLIWDKPFCAYGHLNMPLLPRSNGRFEGRQPNASLAPVLVIIGE